MIEHFKVCKETGSIDTKRNDDQAHDASNPMDQVGGLQPKKLDKMPNDHLVTTEKRRTVYLG